MKLGNGKAFGELALMKDAPRACTIKTTKRCAFAVLNKEDYETILMQGTKGEWNKKLHILEKSSLFGRCSEKELSYISYFFKVRYYNILYSLSNLVEIFVLHYSAIFFLILLLFLSILNQVLNFNL